MKLQIFTLLLLLATAPVFATEPLFIVKVHDDYMAMGNESLNSTQLLKDRLKKEQSPDEVMLHVHACLNIERLAQVVNELLPEYKSRIWIYGVRSDEDCNS